MTLRLRRFYAAGRTFLMPGRRDGNDQVRRLKYTALEERPEKALEDLGGRGVE